MKGAEVNLGLVKVLENFTSYENMYRPDFGTLPRPKVITLFSIERPGFRKQFKLLI